MKWALIGGAAMLLVILAATWLQNAPAASARKAGAAFRRENGVWRVLRAGPSFAY